MAARVSKVANVFKNGRSQAVWIPKEFRFDTDEVLIERKGEKLILTPLQTAAVENLGRVLRNPGTAIRYASVRA